MKAIIFKAKSTIFSVCAVAIALALCLALHYTGAYAVYFNNTVRKLPIYSVGTEEKKISISFDCAWGVDYTDTLLDVLKRENVRHFARARPRRREGDLFHGGILDGKISRIREKDQR